MAPRHSIFLAAVLVLAVTICIALGTAPRSRSQTPGSTAEATVTVALGHVLSRFAPARALGAGVDGHEHGETRQIYTRANERAMRSAGLRPLSYRLRTELGVEAWHWNQRGSWSDPRRRRGYWTGSSRPGRPFEATYGYRLPRRGNTIDQANDDGYSRLDDGRPTFWKSNPYLDPRYTHRRETSQWLVIDLGRPRPVDGVRLDWAAPWARRLEVQYWSGSGDAFYPIVDPGAANPGDWRRFPRSTFAGRPGTQTLRVAPSPMQVRYVRVLLSRSSHRAPRATRDVRDRLGFAVREMHAGRLAAGGLRDFVRHGASNRTQSVAYTSSTDPWHRASDRDPSTEQPSFQTVLRSGLTSGKPVLTPVATLYGIPPDAAAELRYLHALRFPVRRMELGEEPDGQLALPEDYGALYVQFARALHRVDRRVELGGPGFQKSIPDWKAWPDARGDSSWTHRFVLALRRNHTLSALRFFSFEWYPFDNGCAPAAPRLAKAADLLAGVVRRQRLNGLPRGLPQLITEYGYSPYATRWMVDMPGALLNADIVGRFLSLGGQTAYLYGYEPDILIRELRCRSYGNLVLFLADDSHRIRQPVAAYWAARLLTRNWTQPGYRSHALLAATSTEPLLAAYPVRRPDGSVAVLLVNKDPKRTLVTHIDLGAGAPPEFDVSQLSSRDYVWHPRGERGYARPDRPPIHDVSRDGHVVLPPWSITVARTRHAR